MLTLSVTDVQVPAIGAGGRGGRGSVPIASVGLNMGLVVDSLINSVSQLTWHGNVSAWWRCRAFCSVFPADCLSEDPSLALAFVCQLLNEGLSVSSVQRILYVVIHAFSWCPPPRGCGRCCAVFVVALHRRILVGLYLFRFCSLG